MNAERELKTYLRRVGWYLAELPETERTEIIAETQAHIRERLDQGAALSSVLEDLGTAELYARNFIDERQLIGAIGSQRSTDLIGAIARRANRSLTAFLAFTFLIVLSMATLVAVFLAFWKLVDPAHVGVWVSDKVAFAGVIDDPHTAHEILGNWIYPIAAAILALSWIVGRSALSIAVRTLAQSETERMRGAR